MQPVQEALDFCQKAILLKLFSTVTSHSKALTFGFSRIRHSTYPKHSTLKLFLAQTQNLAICLWRFVGLWSKIKRGSVALKPMTGWKVASFNIRMQTQEMDPNDNWDVRKEALVEELWKSNLAIIGLQENGWWEFSFWQYRYRGWGLARFYTMFKSFKFGQVSPLCCLNPANFASVSDNSFHSGIYFQIPVF